MPPIVESKPFVSSVPALSVTALSTWPFVAWLVLLNFTLPPLTYAANALEPHIDAKTMEIHHDKHHAAYVANLNNSVLDASYLSIRGFHWYGYDKTTVSDLAKAIGFSKAYIYKFFDSKQAIGEAICARTLSGPGRQPCVND